MKLPIRITLTIRRSSTKLSYEKFLLQLLVELPIFFFALIRGSEELSK